MTHEHIWQAIDYVARQHNLSSSGLARRCGLDATTFNKSKRVNSYGKLRWPSTQVLAKIFSVTGLEIIDFAQIVQRIQSESEQEKH